MGTTSPCVSAQVLLVSPNCQYPDITSLAEVLVPGTTSLVQVLTPGCCQSHPSASAEVLLVSPKLLLPGNIQSFLSISSFTQLLAHVCYEAHPSITSLTWC